MLNLHEKSYFSPVINDPAVETYITAVKSELTKLKEDNSGLVLSHPNITVSEIRALQELKQDHSLSIKPADKGGAVVGLDTVKYIAEVLRQLEDANIYERIYIDPWFTIAAIIKRVLDEAELAGVIDSDLRDYLVVKHPVTPVFYVLPKIHKTLVDPPG